MRILITAILIAGVLAFSATVSGQDPLAFKLANADSDEPVDRDDASVRVFQDLLNELTERFAEGREEITDVTISAQEDLDVGGVNEKLMTIMEGMTELFIKTVSEQKYSEYVDAYVKLRLSGKSHPSAIEELAEMMEEMGVDCR